MMRSSITNNALLTCLIQVPLLCFLLLHKLRLCRHLSSTGNSRLLRLWLLRLLLRMLMLWFCTLLGLLSMPLLLLLHHCEKLWTRFRKTIKMLLYCLLPLCLCTLLLLMLLGLLLRQLMWLRLWL